MHPAIPPAVLAFLTSLAMAAYVASRRDKTELHWLLLALLASIAIWTAGSIARFSVASEEGLVAALRIVFLGAMTAPPLWLLVAGRYVGLPSLRGRSAYVAVLLPALLCYLALLTNEAHRGVIREVSFGALESGGRAWAGPVFWAFIAYGYACVLGGVVLYGSTARRLLANDERRRALALMAASLIPLLGSAIYLFRLLPVSFDLTPSALVVSLILISTAVFRYQLLESLPLARRDVIEHLEDGVVIASASGAVLDVNPAAESLLGSRAGALRGQSLAAVVGRLARGPGAAAVCASLANLGERSAPLVADIDTHGDRLLEVRAACVRVGAGETAGRFAVLRDRTDARRNERRARRNERLETVATLAAGVAHEVNNPLAFIRSNLGEIHRLGELIDRHRAGPDAKLAHELADLPQIVAETLDGIGRIERLVADMRRLAAPGDEEYTRVDLNDVATDAIRLANLRDDPDVEVDCRLERQLPPVDGSPTRLAQALINLLVNARQAIGDAPGGRIEVETRAEGHAVVVCVRDNGPGMSEQIQNRIFDPFFTTKPPDRGTGLGLSIAYDILRDHGGSLEVASRPRCGAAFHARLPVR